MHASMLVRSLVLAAVLAGAACGHPEDCPEPCPENTYCSMGACVPYHDGGDGEDGGADTATAAVLLAPGVPAGNEAGPSGR